MADMLQAIDKANAQIASSIERFESGGRELIRSALVAPMSDIELG